MVNASKVTKLFMIELSDGGANMCFCLGTLTLINLRNNSRINSFLLKCITETNFWITTYARNLTYLILNNGSKLKRKKRSLLNLLMKKVKKEVKKRNPRKKQHLQKKMPRKTQKKKKLNW